MTNDTRDNHSDHHLDRMGDEYVYMRLLGPPQVYRDNSYLQVVLYFTFPTARHGIPLDPNEDEEVEIALLDRVMHNAFNESYEGKKVGIDYEPSFLRFYDIHEARSKVRNPVPKRGMRERLKEWSGWVIQRTKQKATLCFAPNLIIDRQEFELAATKEWHDRIRTTNAGNRSDLAAAQKQLDITQARLHKARLCRDVWVVMKWTATIAVGVILATSAIVSIWKACN